LGESRSPEYRKFALKLSFVADFAFHEVISFTMLLGLGVKWMSRSIFSPNGPLTD
jgi:hypothetical protein